MHQRGVDSDQKIEIATTLTAALNWRRKVFHFLAVAMFVPGYLVAVGALTHVLFA